MSSWKIKVNPPDSLSVTETPQFDIIRDMKIIPFSFSHLIKEAIMVAVLGFLTGFINNSVSSRRIPLVGQWEKDYGVPSPGGRAAATYGNVEIDLKEAERLYNRGAVFIDARPHAGFVEGHIPGAISLPEEQVQWFISEVGPDQLIVAYCQNMECDEAHILARALREAGAENIFVYAGGIEEWQKSDGPVEDGAGRLE